MEALGSRQEDPNSIVDYNCIKIIKLFISNYFIFFAE